MDVGAHTVCGGQVEQFHVLAVVEAVVQTLDFVVDSCTYGAMIHGDTRTLEYVFERAAQGHGEGLPRVLAADIDFVGHLMVIGY